MKPLSFLVAWALCAGCGSPLDEDALRRDAERFQAGMSRQEVRQKLTGYRWLGSWREEGVVKPDRVFQRGVTWTSRDVYTGKGHGDSLSVYFDSNDVIVAYEYVPGSK